MFISGKYFSFILALMSLIVSEEFNVTVVGYGPFLNYTNNPSGEIAQMMNDQIYDNIHFKGFVTSVDNEGVKFMAEHLRELQNESPELLPDLALMLGLNAGSPKVLIELAAVNIKSDGTGEIVRGGPNILGTTTKVGAYEILKDNDVTFSNDAGTYYCNEESYRTFWEIQNSEIFQPKTKKLLQALFIHVPTDQNLSLERDIEAIVRIVKFILNERN